MWHLLRLCLVGVLLLLASKPTFGTEGWELRTEGIPSTSVSYIWTDAVDANTVWICGLGDKTLVFRSTDFGETWIDANPYPDSTGLPRWEVGAIAAWDDLEAVMATERGKIFRTTDGGVNWTVVFEDAGVTTFFNYMKMVDDTHGFAIGDAPDASSPAAVLKTTDAGWTWTPINHDLPVGCYQLMGPTCDFVSREVGYTLQDVPNDPGGSSRRRTIFKTTDGGTTWTELPERPGIVYSICFVDESTGFVTEMYQQPGIHKTTNGGTTWQLVKSAPSPYFVSCSPGGTRIWSGTKEINASDDMGGTWYSQAVTLPGGAALRCGSFLSKDMGVIVGDNTVLVTTNGGIITGAEDAEQLPQEYMLLQNYPNPFNPSTTIAFAVPHGGFVTLKVYNLLGEEVATLIAGDHAAGTFKATWDASELPSGVYFYRLMAGDYVQTKKAVLMK
ncbi:MAG: YCF48-related protein [Bacteroidota bacterium]